MENNNNINNVQPQAQPQPAPGPVQQPVYQQPVYPQPVYQEPYQYQGPAYNIPQLQVDPLIQKPVPTAEERANRRVANILCFISIALKVIPYFLYGTLSGATNAFDGLDQDSYEAMEVLISIVAGGLGLSYIASWVLVLIARIKYKTTFSKVLLWIYIGILAVTIIGVVLIVAMCAYMLKDCRGF